MGRDLLVQQDMATLMQDREARAPLVPGSLVVDGSRELDQRSVRVVRSAVGIRSRFITIRQVIHDLPVEGLKKRWHSPFEKRKHWKGLGRRELRIRANQIRRFP